MKDSTIDQFNNAIRAAGNGITMVLFHSEWLPKEETKELLESFDAVSSRFQDTTFLQFSVNKQSHIPESLGIKAVPSLCGFKGNEFVDMKVGFMSAALIIKFTEQVINGTTHEESEY